jgi:sugar/nucleoside kinase (ribokinase family)
VLGAEGGREGRGLEAGFRVSVEFVDAVGAGDDADPAHAALLAGRLLGEPASVRPMLSRYRVCILYVVLSLACMCVNENVCRQERWTSPRAGRF